MRELASYLREHHVNSMRQCDAKYVAIDVMENQRGTIEDIMRVIDEHHYSGSTADAEALRKIHALIVKHYGKETRADD